MYSGTSLFVASYLVAVFVGVIATLAAATIVVASFAAAIHLFGVMILRFLCHAVSPGTTACTDNSALPDGVFDVKDSVVTTLIVADPFSLYTAAAAPVVDILVSVFTDVAGPLF